MRISTCFGTLVLSLGLTACFAPAVDATARMIEFQPEGDIGITNGPVSSLNSVESLGLGSEEQILGAMVDFQWGGPHISVSTQQGSWNGSGTLNAEFSDGSVTIPVGTDVDSELDLAIHSGVITWDLLPGDAELGLGFGVEALDLAGSFRSQATGDSIDFDEMVPIPVLALRANVQLGPIELGGYAAGFQIDYDGDEATFLDLDLMARYHIIGGDNRLSGSILAGYRTMSLELDYQADSGEQVETDLEFSGPFVGAQFSF